MSKLRYTPDDDIPVHREGAINLLCKPFQSHENGLPEWIKNASDEYVRRNATFEQRIVVLMLSNKGPTASASISCLDAGGMTSSTIQEHFRFWASPDASLQGRDKVAVLGGHGNGGKCYMTHMFEESAILTTVRDGRGNRYGVPGGSIQFGYVPDPARARDYPVADVLDELARALEPTRCTLKSLPDEMISAIQRSGGFTLVTGLGPKGCDRELPVAELAESLEDHPQMLRPLRLCRVFVVWNGRSWNKGKPIQLPEIEPLPGGTEPRHIAIPDHLTDPVSRSRIATKPSPTSAVGSLTLRTSNTSMRWSKKTRHSIIFTADADFVGSVPVPELDIQSPFRDRIYGECELESLGPLKQNERGRPAESPLSRALLQFIAYQIQKYAEEFERRDRRRYNQAEKEAVSRINEALDRWKNQLVDEFVKGLWGDNGDNPPPGPVLPVGVPATIEVSTSHSRIGRGVPTRPVVKFYDKKGQRIRPVPFHWVSDDNNVVMVDEELGIVEAFSYGKATIHAETVQGAIRSNKVALEVVRIKDVTLEPDEVEVALGGRASLRAVCRLEDGSRVSDVLLVWTESNSSVARVSSGGAVYGFAIGETEVVAGDDGVTSSNTVTVTVVEGTGGRGGDGKHKGRGHPRVLVSGEFDGDPDTGAFVNFSGDDPPVWQRPEDSDRGIWWINSAAPLARLYLDSSRGYGYQSREWRMYHVERYVDVIVQIAMRFGDQAAITPNEWILVWGEKLVEIQARIASELEAFIWTGDLPTN